MSKITSMKLLRDRVLQAIDDLEDGKIDISETSCLAKLSETVISGLRSEMQYAILTQQQPEIPFFGEGSGIFLDKKDIKKLL